MNKNDRSTHAVFDRDTLINTGYLYTTNARLSSRMANRRLSDITQWMVGFRGKRVIDIGCGDGTYTIELFDRGKPSLVHGIDPAEHAIAIAQQKVQGRNIVFAAHSAYALPYAADSFDVAHLRRVLHHVERPLEVLQEAFRVAPMVLIIEPNGYNPVLKLLERFSPYHREHNEKSYSARRIDN